MAGGDEDDHLSLFTATIHRDAARRIDKYRAHLPTVTSLHPATLKDAGKSIAAVAKITATTSAQVIARMIECAEIHRSLHNHRAILKVYGVQTLKPYFVLFLEKAEGSLRDVLSPTSDEMRALRDRLFSTTTRREIIHEVFRGLAYIHSKTDEALNRISHRDVKPENLLLVLHERYGTLAVKFGDFDSAKESESGDRMVAVTTQAFTESYKDPNIDKKTKAGRPIVIDDYVNGDVYAAAVR